MYNCLLINIWKQKAGILRHLSGLTSFDAFDPLVLCKSEDEVWWGRGRGGMSSAMQGPGGLPY